MKGKRVKQNDNNLAIAYYRFSSSAQNEASIDQQREVAQKYAAEKGFKIIKEYSDAAMTGTNDDRPEFQLMLFEVSKIRPAALIVWKTDRLGRDRYDLAIAKKRIRDAGCEIHYVAEAMPSNSPEAALMEGLLESMAEFYSKQLAQNVTRGLYYNANNALFNGHKLLGYKVGKDKKYILDDDTVPFVRKIFDDYLAGKTMTDIANDLNNQGIKTAKGNHFTVNGLREILRNRAYIGEYHFADVVIPGGMPAIISEEQFLEIQKKFKENKRKGGQKSKGLDENGAPRYWLTGKLYCGHCGTTMQGVSGTSRNGDTHYYYYCKHHRKHMCKKKNIKKKQIENAVIFILRGFLSDTENLASLAVDISNYYKKLNQDNGYLKSLEKQLKDVQKSLNNLVRAIEQGIFSETTQERLQELEKQKKLINEAIETEKVKQNLANHSVNIQHFFELFKNADFKDDFVRNNILEYFVDKIFLYDDKIVIACWYSEEKYEVPWEIIDEAVNGSTTSCSSA